MLLSILFSVISILYFLSDIHHPIGNSAKQTQNHPKQTGNNNKGHKNGATAISLMKPMNLFMAGFIPFLINFCL